MAKHSVATLNTKMTSERGVIRRPASLVSRCLYWCWWWEGAEGKEEH